MVFLYVYFIILIRIYIALTNVCLIHLPFYTVSQILVPMCPLMPDRSLLDNIGILFENRFCKNWNTNITFIDIQETLTKSKTDKTFKLLLKT